MTAPAPPSSWPISGRLLDALSRRDFPAFERCLADTVRLRALVPPGPFELSGPVAVADKFHTWFGGEEEFELVEASASEIGTKQYLRWRIRLTSPESGQSRTAEQHVYTTGRDRIETIDLLCSGFQAANGGAR